MKDFFRAKMSQIEGKIVEFCRDRRLRTFLKVVQKNLQHTCLKRGRGGGVKGRLNNV